MNDLALSHFWCTLRQILGDELPSRSQWETICRHFDEAFKDEHNQFAEHFKALYEDPDSIEVVRGEDNPDVLYRHAQALQGDLLPAPESKPHDSKETHRKLAVTRKLLESLS